MYIRKTPCGEYLATMEVMTINKRRGMVWFTGRTMSECITKAINYIYR